MTPRGSRTRRGTREDAKARARVAKDFLATAEDAFGAERYSVAAANAADAGIAAADAICIAAVGQYSRGADHHHAVDLLRPIDREAAAHLSRLLDVKDQSHYGTRLMTPGRASAALEQARRIVDRAGRALEP